MFRAIWATGKAVADMATAPSTCHRADVKWRSRNKLVPRNQELAIEPERFKDEISQGHHDAILS